VKARSLMQKMFTVAGGPNNLELFQRFEKSANGTQSVRRIISNQDPDTAIVGFHCTSSKNNKAFRSC
jgi:hypothetical protein